ncbi:MAG: OPT/YSL family transporter [Deltaproteobacteria bacterium]|nr:OPT/YSL family transporter [Deltaproteobacteria bacterium]
MPSATGLGLAFVIPAWNSISMFIGAVIAYGVHRLSKPASERYNVAVASGLIAGESLVGVAVVLYMARGMFAQVWDKLPF